LNIEKVKELNGKYIDEQKKVDIRQKEIDKLLIELKKKEK
jgi:hypothetical protein